METREKLLYLVHRVPYPPNRGDRIRSYHLLRFLAERYDVHLATLADEPVPAETATALEALCPRLSIAPVGGLSRWARACVSLASGRTVSEGLFQSSQLACTVRAWAREHDYAAAVVFCSSMLQYLEIPELEEVPAIVDLVDVDSQKWFDYAEHVAGPKRWLYSLEGRRVRALERRAVGRARAITLVSEAEAELFRGVCPNDRTVAIPNGVDLDYFRPANDGRRPWQPLPAADRTNLVFVGALDYHANIDGVTWFVREVWPLVRREMPNLTLGLVGRKPAPAVQRLAETSDIRVFGTVPDVRPHLAAADLVIAPLRIARGIQNKVLEAMAMGKPVICSPGAAAGLKVSAGQDLLVANAPSTWTSSIKSVLETPKAARALSLAARESTESCYRWNFTLGALEELLPKQSPGIETPEKRVWTEGVAAAVVASAD